MLALLLRGTKQGSYSSLWQSWAETRKYVCTGRWQRHNGGNTKAGAWYKFDFRV